MGRLSDEKVMIAKGYPVQHLLGLPYDRQLKICCPLHNENTPSFQVYSDGHWFCFGCSAHGRGALDLLTSMGEPFYTAVKRLTGEL